MARYHTWRQLAGLILLIALGMGSFSSSEAAPITFGFTGAVTQTTFDPDDPFDGGIDVDTAITGSYTFESTAADVIPGASTAGYVSPVGAAYRFAVTIGGHAFSTSDFLSIGLANNVAGVDQYTVLACAGGASCPGLMLELFLQDLGGTVFGSAALPLRAPSLGAFEIRTFALRGLIDDHQIEILGRLASLDCSAGCDPAPAPIPEPGTLLPLASGLAVLRARRYQRR